MPVFASDYERSPAVRRAVLRNDLQRSIDVQRDFATGVKGNSKLWPRASKRTRFARQDTLWQFSRSQMPVFSLRIYNRAVSLLKWDFNKSSSRDEICMLRVEKKNSTKAIFNDWRCDLKRFIEGSVAVVHTCRFLCLFCFLQIHSTNCSFHTSQKSDVMNDFFVWSCFVSRFLHLGQF